METPERSRPNSLAGLDGEGVEADVVVDRGGEVLVLLGESHELGRLLRAHGQRLLTQDVFAGFETGLGHGEVEPVGRGNVNRLHARVTEKLTQGGIGAGSSHLRGERTRLLRGNAQHSDHLTARPTKRLRVDTAHEARTDDSDSHSLHGFLHTNTCPERILPGVGGPRQADRRSPAAKTSPPVRAAILGLPVYSIGPLLEGDPF
jgi:hypothetical protein